MTELFNNRRTDCLNRISTERWLDMVIERGVVFDICWCFDFTSIELQPFIATIRKTSPSSAACFFARQQCCFDAVYAIPCLAICFPITGSITSFTLASIALDIPSLPSAVLAFVDVLTFFWHSRASFKYWIIPFGRPILTMVMTAQKSETDP